MIGRMAGFAVKMVVNAKEVSKDEVALSLYRYYSVQGFVSASLPARIMDATGPGLLSFPLVASPRLQT